MIDTTKIRDCCEKHPLDDKKLLNSLPCGIEDLCDRIDELERKLKIAEDCLERIQFAGRQDTTFILASFADKALKKIRGE